MIEDEGENIGELEGMSRDMAIFEHRRLPKFATGEKFQKDAENLVQKVKSDKETN